MSTVESRRRPVAIVIGLLVPPVGLVLLWRARLSWAWRLLGTVALVALTLLESTSAAETCEEEALDEVDPLTRTLREGEALDRPEVVRRRQVDGTTAAERMVAGSSR